jgi:hypothetical protein
MTASMLAVMYGRLWSCPFTGLGLKVVHYLQFGLIPLDFLWLGFLTAGLLLRKSSNK